MEEKAWELPSLGAFPVCTPRGLGKGRGVETEMGAAVPTCPPSPPGPPAHVSDRQTDVGGWRWEEPGSRPALPLPTWLPWGVWAAKWAPHVPSVN